MGRKEIWEEMKKAKTYQLTCLHYTDKKRKFNRRYNFAIIVVGVLGAPTFFLNHWCAFISTIAASVMEIVKSFIPALCQSEEELVKIDNLSVYFGEVLQKLEYLWNKNEQNISATDVEFSKILKKVPENTAQMNKLIHSLSKEEEQTIMNDADEYLTSKFY